jgi:hypothetical protein
MPHLETHFPNEHNIEIVTRLGTMREWVYVPYVTFELKLGSKGPFGHQAHVQMGL